jgi:hypothetical protein
MRRVILAAACLAGFVAAAHAPRPGRAQGTTGLTVESLRARIEQGRTLIRSQREFLARFADASLPLDLRRLADEAREVLRRAEADLTDLSARLGRARGLTTDELRRIAAAIDGVLGRLRANADRLNRIRVSLRTVSFVVRLLVQASRQLNRAREALARAPRQRGQSLFVQAQDALASGESAFQSGNLRLARQLAERSLTLARQVVALAADRDELRRGIERLTRDVEVARRGRSTPVPAGSDRRLESAARAATAARDAYLADQTGVAEARLAAARRDLESARQLSRAEARQTGRPSPARDRALGRIRSAEEQVQRTERLRGTRPDLVGAGLLDRARQHLARARDLAGRGADESASAHARLAQRLAQRAQDLLVPRRSQPRERRAPAVASAATAAAGQ